MNLQILLAETLGVLIFVLVHGGILASIVFNGKGKEGLGAFAVFAGITFGGYTAVLGGSGGHINPAVTMAFFAAGDITLVESLTYIIGQLLGGILGAAVLYLLYFPQFKASSSPLAPLTGNPEKNEVVPSLVASIIGSLLLSFLVVTSVRLTGPVSSLTPVVVGAAVTASALTVGGTAYAVLNPARDLGPRITATLLKIGKPEWSTVLILVLGSLLGGWLAGLIFNLILGAFYT